MKRMRKILFILVISGFGLYILSYAVSFATCTIAIYGSLTTSKIGAPEDRIDAYVPDGHMDQHWFVGFEVRNVVKGEYKEQNLGLRLHSPAIQFWIRDDAFQGRRYLLFLRKVRLQDNQNVLLLQRQLRLR